MSLSLNEFFTDNAVLPHGKPFKVYGEGEGEVTVTLGEAEAKTECRGGKWSVTMPPMECGGPYTLTVGCGGETITRSNLLVGEVILVFGQSNMQFKLRETGDSPDTFITNDALRLFTVDRPEAGEYFKTSDGWVCCEKETAGHWTALGYYIAEELNRASNTAVGIIACYQGASMIQSWLPESLLDDADVYVPIDQRHSDYTDFPVWNGDGFLYRTMLERVIPYSVNRVVYYQGESNTTEAEGRVYDKLLYKLITVVRDGQRDPSLPVTVVQIADLDVRNDEGWRSVQRAQLRVTHLSENVRTVISADISETDNIHPLTKKPLAIRIVKSFK